MASLLHVQINIVLAVLLIILLGHAFFNMNRQKITNRIFMWIMAVTCLIVTTEIVDVILNNPNLKQFVVFHKLVNVFGLSAAPSIPLMGYIFIIEWVNCFQKKKIKFNYALLLPLLISAIGNMISYYKNVIFYIDSESVYHRGYLFFILPCVSFIYFIFGMSFIYKHRKKLTNSELLVFNSIYIIPAIATFIQLFKPNYLTIWNSTAIIIVITYIFILTDQVYRDGMTGLGNRLAYERYAQKANNKKVNKLFLIYIDIDDFKPINDKYGHSEGDEAIKLFSNLLTDSFTLRKKEIMRLGGDEFIILLKDQQREKVVAYLQKFTRNLEAYNNSEEKPYKLNFSYGLAEYTYNYKTIYQLLEYADQLMYEQKQIKKDTQFQ